MFMLTMKSNETLITNDETQYVESSARVNEKYIFCPT